MSLGQIETLARENVPAVIVVLNNCGYENIRHEQIVRYGRERTIGMDLGDVDFAAVARGCGVDGERVHDTATLATAVRNGLSSGGPYLIDVLIGGEPNVWTFPPFRPFARED